MPQGKGRADLHPEVGQEQALADAAGWPAAERQES